MSNKTTEKTKKFIEALETAYLNGNDLVVIFPNEGKITIENAAIPTMRNIIGDPDD